MAEVVLIVGANDIKFDAAHRIVGYNGACSNLHGHTWKVNVTVVGARSLRNALGMLMDFNTIKNVIRRFDHTTILKDCSENRTLGALLNDCVIWMLDNPTAECLAMHFYKVFHSIDSRLLYRIQVFESDVTSATAGDIDV